LLGLTKFDYLSPVVGSSYDGAQRDDQYVQQLMALCAHHARVRHFAQVFYQAEALGFCHAGYYGLF
jgi:hypothetical protein